MVHLLSKEAKMSKKTTTDQKQNKQKENKQTQSDFIRHYRPRGSQTQPRKQPPKQPPSGGNKGKK